MAVEEAILNWLIGEKTINEEERELYEYALSVLWSSVSLLILVLIVGVITGTVREGLLFLLPFLIMRKFSGGFHTRRMWTCIVSSTIVLSTCMVCIKYLCTGIMMNIVLVIALCSLMIWSPVDTENRRLNPEEKRSCKAIVFAMAVVFGLLYLMLVLSKHNQAAVCIAIGIILTASLQLPHIVESFLKTE